MRTVHDLQMIYMRLQFVVSPTAWGVFVVLHALHGLRFLLTLHSRAGIDGGGVFKEFLTDLSKQHYNGIIGLT